MDEPTLTFRQARRDDLDAIVRMLADDTLGRNREAYATPLPQAYVQAFDTITQDPNNELVVAEHAGEVVGVLQLVFIPSLTYQGRWRALVEGVRVASSARSLGIGRRMFEWTIQRARKRGCHVLQLTSDKARTDAVRFYQSLGFVASHEGMKLRL